MEGSLFLPHLIYLLTLVKAYEKCTRGISHYECYVGNCCKIKDQWDCRLQGLEECDSLAEQEAIITQRPPTSGDNDDNISIGVPVGVAAGCVVLLVLCALFAFYMRKKYREKNYTSQDRSSTRSMISSTSQLVDDEQQQQQQQKQQQGRVWSTRQQQTNYSENSSRPSRDYGINETVVSTNNDEMASNKDLGILENYQKPPRRPRSRQTSSSRSANNSKIPTRDNENDRKLPSTNNYDNQDLVFLEPYDKPPRRSRRREEANQTSDSRYSNSSNKPSRVHGRLPNDRPPNYAETMRSTEV